MRRLRRLRSRSREVSWTGGTGGGRHLAAVAPVSEECRHHRLLRVWPVTRRLAVAAMAVVLAACAINSPTGSAGTPAAPPATVAVTSAPTASPPASPTATPLPSPRTATRGVDWEWRDVYFEDPLGRQPSLVGVIFTGTGFTAWGPNSVGGSAIVASSNTLAGWRQVDEPGQFDGVQIIAMAWAPARIVALGADKAGSTRAWRSPDGVVWKAGPARTGIDGTVHALIASSGGIYYAAGTAKGACDVAIWFSYDGFAWQPSEPLTGARGTCTSGKTPVSPAITLLREGPAGVVAYGSVPGIGNAFWTSADRVHWTFHPQPALVGHIAGLAATRSGYVAVGDTGTGSAAVWLSPDGTTWTATPDQAVLHDATMADVRTLDDGSLVAVGSDPSYAFVAWTSTDGLIWVRGPSALYPNGGSLGRPDHPVNWVLASDGHSSSNPAELVIAGAGGSRAMVSSPITPGLRAATLTIALSGRVDLSSETVAGTCSDHGDGTGATDIVAHLANLAAPNPAQVSLVVTPDGGGTSFAISMDNLEVSVDVGIAPIDPSTFAITPGSTAERGSATFRGLADTLSRSGTTPLSGSVAWACAGS